MASRHPIWWDGRVWECPCGFLTKVDAVALNHLMSDVRSVTITDFEPEEASG